MSIPPTDRPTPSTHRLPRRSRLNVFQRLVRQWDRVHPYNAAQILHLAVQYDREALQAAWRDSLAALGLGQVRSGGSTYSVEPLNGQFDENKPHARPCPEGYCVAEAPIGAGLEQFVSEQINRPFLPDADVPLRPFVLRNGGSCYIGIVYQHWIADSQSIRMLMRQWFMRLHDPPQATREPVELARHGYWRLFGPNAARWNLVEQSLRLFRFGVRLRRARKLLTQGSKDFSMRFLLRRLPPGTIQPLLAFARRHGLTLNDVFLATMAQVCDSRLPMRDIPRRTDLALGTIVDLRKRSRGDFSNTFGLFLGFSNIICRRSDLDCWPRLAAHIAEQSREHKASDVPQASTLWILTALVAGRFLSPTETFRFYRKHLPLAAGLSNVNLNGTWAQAYHPQPLLEYIRVSPTGPMVPLVFTPTTLGEDLHIGLTYRAAIISDDDARELADTFVERLTQLAACGDNLFAAAFAAKDGPEFTDRSI